jgi:GTP pyrophosphokinase
MLGNDTGKFGPNFELFFAPLEIELDPNTLESIRFAYIVSKYGHHDQTRDDESRYFDHPKGAAWIYINEFEGRDPRIIIDLLLHDISEDAYLLSPYRISWNFGRDIALDVRAVTKMPKGKESVDQYLRRIIAQGPWAITTKLLDRLHNVKTLEASSEEKQKRQRRETRENYIPTLIPALRSHGGKWAEYADSLDRKIKEALREIEDRNT